MTAMVDAHLRIYLNDHLAGSVAALELARRSLSRNRSSPLGRYLRTFIAEAEADRRTLEEVMRRVGARPDPLKRAAAWSAEKVGRLKLNGRLLGYSDLSRLEELEGLCLGVEGKRALWRARAKVADGDRRLQGFDFERLARRAQGQRRALEEHRMRAAATALQGPDGEPATGPG